MAAESPEVLRQDQESGLRVRQLSGVDGKRVSQ